MTMLITYNVTRWQGIIVMVFVLIDKHFNEFYKTVIQHWLENFEINNKINKMYKSNMHISQNNLKPQLDEVKLWKKKRSIYYNWKNLKCTCNTNKYHCVIMCGNFAQQKCNPKVNIDKFTKLELKIAVT